MARTLYILGIPYTVVMSDTLAQHDRVAHVDHTKQLITLASGMRKEFGQQALIHEVLHAILYTLGHGEAHDDEQFVQSLSSALFQMGFEPKLIGENK